jgi:hypothetical protein
LAAAGSASDTVIRIIIRITTGRSSMDAIRIDVKID